MGEKTFHIERYCHIKKGEVLIDGKSVFKDDFENFPQFIKSVYKNYDTDYPKFFKMDNLSKLAFMASDLILKTSELQFQPERDIALVFANNGGSIDTDRRHQESIESPDGIASPALFVYTLPNICMGEISIKHRLFSENSFFIFNRFNAPHLFNYANCLLKAEKAEKVLCGWVDFDDEEFEAFMYLVSENGDLVHSTDEIKRIYNA